MTGLDPLPSPFTLSASFITFTKPPLLEIEYHPYLLAHLEPVFALHDKYGIVTQAYGPLTPVLRHPTGGPLKPILAKIAEKLSNESGKPVDASAVLLLWTINKGVVAVTTSGNPKNIEKMAAIESLRDLTKEEIEEIDTAGRKVHFRYYVSVLSAGVWADLGAFRLILV